MRSLRLVALVGLFSMPALATAGRCPRLCRAAIAECHAAGYTRKSCKRQLVGDCRASGGANCAFTPPTTTTLAGATTTTATSGASTTTTTLINYPPGIVGSWLLEGDRNTQCGASWITSQIAPGVIALIEQTYTGDYLLTALSFTRQPVTSITPPAGAAFALDTGPLYNCAIDTVISGTVGGTGVLHVDDSYCLGGDGICDTTGTVVPGVLQ
jgi:hypothetical protein